MTLEYVGGRNRRFEIIHREDTEQVLFEFIRQAIIDSGLINWNQLIDCVCDSDVDKKGNKYTYAQYTELIYDREHFNNIKEVYKQAKKDFKQIKSK